MPPANTLVRWVNEQRLRPHSAGSTKSHLWPTCSSGVSPNRLQPDTSPQTLRIPDRSGHPVLRRESRRPARHYPRLWIQRPSSERRRDFNPPDSCAAQRTLCPLLTSAPRSGRLATSSVPKDTVQISRSKPDSLHRTPAGFTALALDGYGLCDILPARPASAASYPVSVRRVATLLHASFRQSLAVLPPVQARGRLLRFASASPPSGCTGDFHPQNCRTCPIHRPLRAACGGGLRPVLTAAARAARCSLAGRDGETVPDRTKKLPLRDCGGGELIAHPAIEHHQHLAHTGYERHPCLRRGRLLGGLPLADSRR